MSRAVIWTTVIVALLATGVIVVAGMISRDEWRFATDDGAYRDFRQYTTEQLEQDIRSRVPLGSSREFVVGFLTREQMKFANDPKMNAISAGAQCQGRGFHKRALWLSFHFDGDSKLTSIYARVVESEM